MCQRQEHVSGELFLRDLDLGIGDGGLFPSLTGSPTIRKAA
jgi:hypothetical protein